MLGAGEAHAVLCPDGTEAEFCLPPPVTPPVTPQVTPQVTPPVTTPAAVAPARPLLVDVDRLDARVVPLGAAFGWQSFSRDLLEILPQKVRSTSTLAEPLPDGEPDSDFRFSLKSGGYFSEREGWRLRLFGGGFGGPLIQGASGGNSSFSGAQTGLLLNYAVGDVVIGAFGRFGSFSADAGSFAATGGTQFGGRSARTQLGGGGLLVQVAKPSWFVGLAAGGDGLQADQPFAINSSNAFGIRSSTPTVGGSAFNLATRFGGRISLSESQILEPSALLSLTSLSLGGITVPDLATNRLWNVPSSNSTVGTADIGLTWRATLKDGPNLITPSLRLSWLGAGFLGNVPTNRVTDGFGLATNLAAGGLIQGSGLGLQGGLAYTLRDNTTFYVRGGAGFYGGGTSWDLGGGIQLRWGGAPLSQTNAAR